MRTDFSRDGCATATKACGGEVAAGLSPTLRLGRRLPPETGVDFGRKSIHGGRKNSGSMGGGDPSLEKSVLIAPTSPRQPPTRACRGPPQPRVMSQGAICVKF
jgi:hypothetical protein